MTRVRMARQITGLRDGVPWPGIGEEIDLPQWEAENLLSNGDCRLVPSGDLDDAGGAVDPPAGERVSSPAGNRPSRRRRKTEE